MKEQNEYLFEFGRFCLDPLKRQLLRDGQIVALTPKAVAALLILVSRRGEIVTKDALMSGVWFDTIVEENNLTQQISTLRRTLGEKRDENRYIVTIPGQGYSFIAPVRRSFYRETELVLEEITESSITIDICDDEKIPPPALPAPLSFWAHPVNQFLGACLVFAYLFVFWSIYAVHHAAPSFAVLPFKSIGQNGSNDSLSEGITETLTAKIGNLKSLTVRPAGSPAEYIGQEQNPVEAGRKLKVDNVLAGSIQREGERVRVTIQVIDVNKNRIVWGKSFDPEAVDSFTLQDMISEEVSAALRSRFSS